MRNNSFTQYDVYPEGMLVYLSHNGPHFNRKLCEFAASRMYRMVGEKETPITPFTKEEVVAMLRSHGISLKNNQLYDFVYVADMCKADFLGSSIVDNAHLSRYVKDVIDDVDAPDGLIFNRWYADMCYKGIAIDWEEML